MDRVAFSGTAGKSQRPRSLQAQGCVSSSPVQQGNLEATPVGFEPTRGDPIGLAGRRLNCSAKVSSNLAPLCRVLAPQCRFRTLTYALQLLLLAVQEDASATRSQANPDRPSTASSVQQQLYTKMCLGASDHQLRDWRQHVLRESAVEALAGTASVNPKSGELLQSPRMP